jgi:RNA polymerase sigma-70 factor (ECF subfamily)
MSMVMVGTGPEAGMETDSASGLQQAFAENRPKLLRLITARLRNAHDAEDVMQDMWLRLCGVQSGPVANPLAYLHRMALNLANDLVRERSRRVRRDSGWTETTVSETNGMAFDPAPDAERVAAGRQELGTLLADIQAMPERMRQVFRRHRIDGASHGEIAAEMAISRSAVEKHMAAAMRHLLSRRQEREQA